LKLQTVAHLPVFAFGPDEGAEVLGDVKLDPAVVGLQGNVPRDGPLQIQYDIAGLGFAVHGADDIFKLQVAALVLQGHATADLTHLYATGSIAHLQIDGRRHGNNVVYGVLAGQRALIDRSYAQPIGLFLYDHFNLVEVFRHGAGFEDIDLTRRL